MPWYKGDPLWQSLCSFSLSEKKEGGGFRMPLQDIYRFSKNGDTRRIYCGTITSGNLKKGDSVFFHPSQKEGVIATIESQPSAPSSGFAIGFTLEDPIFVERGELICKKENPLPIVSDRLKVRLFWMSSRPILKEKKYIFRIHTSKVGCFIKEILTIQDSVTQQAKKETKAYDIIECILCTVKPVAFDLSPDFFETNRFVLVDAFEMICSGIILENSSFSQDSQ